MLVARLAGYHPHDNAILEIDSNTNERAMLVVLSQSSHFFSNCPCNMFASFGINEIADAGSVSGHAASKLRVRHMRIPLLVN